MTQYNEVRQSPIRVYWSPDYCRPAYEFDTTRKSKLVADKLVASGTKLASPTTSSNMLYTKTLIGQEHSAEYVDAIKTGKPRSLAQSQGFVWDQGIWEMALASTAGTVRAAHDAVSRQANAGSLSSGLHHARRDHGAGFCTINGLAVAAKALVADAKKAGKKIVILDFDAHCGGGTNSFLVDDPELYENVVMIDVSTESFDSYVPAHPASRLYLPQLWDTGEFRLLPNADRLYLDTCRQALDAVPWADAYVVLYNAGVDSYPELGYNTITNRELLVFREARKAIVPVSFVLAGGYEGPNATMEDIVGLHYSTVRAAEIHSMTPMDDKEMSQNG